MFTNNPKIPNNIKSNMKLSELSKDNQKNISISIGKWIDKHPSGICKLYDIPIFIIYGEYDITYKKPSTKICKQYNCTEIKNAGHYVLLSHNNEVIKWLNNSMKIISSIYVKNPDK